MFKERLQHFLKKVGRNSRIDATPELREELTVLSEVPTPKIEIEGVITEHNVPFIAASIVVDGQRTTEWFMVDTGASITVLPLQVAQNLKLNFDQLRTDSITWLTEEFRTPCYLVSADLYFKGKNSSQERPIFIKTTVDISVPNTDLTDNYGILGRDVLNRFDYYEIDFAQKKLRLEARDSSSAGISVTTSIPNF